MTHPPSSSAYDGAAPAGFAAALFGRTAQEDLHAYDARALALLAEAAWRRLAAPREAGQASVTIADPERGDPRLSQITVIEVVNDDMPFLLESTLAELNEAGVDLRLVAHPVFAVDRDDSGALLRVHLDGSAAPQSRRESFIHIHVARLGDEERRAALKRGLETTFQQVRLAVGDRVAMFDRVAGALLALRADPPALAADEIAEAAQFLEWMLAGNFVFLGQRLYSFIEDPGAESAPAFDPIPDSGLGILRDPDVKVLRRGRELVAVTPEVIEFLRDSHVLIVTKANVKSRVRRRVHMDYIGVKRFDAAGRPIGELRVVGQFTAAAYTQSTQAIPYIRHKVARVLEGAGLDPSSHSGRVLVETLENYPRDELFQIDVATLARFAAEIAALQERPRLRVLTRIDRFDRFVSVLAFLPRDRFDTRVQTRLGQELARVYDGRVSATYPYHPEGPLTRVHYIIGRYEGSTPNPPRQAVEAAAAAIVRTWSDSLRARLLATQEAAGPGLAAQWASAFSAGYMEAFAPDEALKDIALAQRLTEESPYAVSLRRRAGEARRADFEVFSRGRPMPLSERAPVLENMGFRVVSERTFEIARTGGERIWLHDMLLERLSGEDVDFETRGAEIETTVMAVFRGEAENDGYNALILEAGLGWREAAALRALSRYLRQIGVNWSQSYMWQTAARNADVVRLLFDLFAIRFDPRLALSRDERAERQAHAVATIETQLRRVASLDEDRILRRFLNLILAAVRTNFFMVEPDGAPPPVVAFKLESRGVDELPLPKPLYEVTLCSPRVEGIHLRFGKVARGGLRWSDRPQDFRTEILGLAKAQQVKNAVIVPVGAKGGFVAKRLPPATRGKEWMAEGIASYRLFVGALLDVTDNLVGESVVGPAGVERWDGDDPYLVVAADKGTATFSDIANAIAAERSFWLDDAFASGGSAGYDHKKMGITARGAWEAVKRHFRELETNIQTTPFTVAGVGDMSGDVFGNAMLLSPATRLVAAFDHRDIFLDPDPDAARSFEERARLFARPRSSWQDYDRAAISEGGGVYSRDAKSIPLSPQVQTALGLRREAATPDEVLSAIVRARVDLLWFGGIGTFVRASDETNEEAGDRANDSIRVTAADLRCKVVGEGANLAVTQRARIEAARRGVRLNTDAIDNSAGVNTSDVEVNIKIALSQPVREGELDRAARDLMLADMTDEAAALVLRNNYRQTLAISLAERGGADDVGFAARLMRRLEADGRLDRAVEFLPSDAALAQRAKAGSGLTRPEIAVLLAYAKLALHDELLASDATDDPYFARELTRYFPSALSARFPRALASHRLRREIIAAELANGLIDRGGPAIVSRLADETGAGAAAIVRAYAVVRDVFSLIEIESEIDALDAKVPGAAQLDLYAALQRLLVSRLAWFLRNVDFAGGLGAVTARFRAGIEALASSLQRAAPGQTRQAVAQQAHSFEQSGAPPELARTIASLATLASACDIVLIAEQADRPLREAVAAYFAVDQTFGASALAEATRRVDAHDYYERLALDRTLDAMERGLRRLAGKAVAAGGSDIAAWIAARPQAARVRAALAAMLAEGLTLPKAIVAESLLRELIGD